MTEAAYAVPPSANLPPMENIPQGEPVGPSGMPPPVGSPIPEQMSMISGNSFNSGGNIRMRGGQPGVKPFPCPICGKRFSQKGNMKMHQRVHTGEKPFACPTCGKRFSQKGNMQTHTRIHSGVKPFECVECKQAFRQKSKLLAHMKRHQQVAGSQGVNPSPQQNQRAMALQLQQIIALTKLNPNLLSKPLTMPLLPISAGMLPFSSPSTSHKAPVPVASPATRPPPPPPPPRSPNPYTQSQNPHLMEYPKSQSSLPPPPPHSLSSVFTNPSSASSWAPSLESNSLLGNETSNSLDSLPSHLDSLDRVSYSDRPPSPSGSGPLHIPSHDLPHPHDSKFDRIGGMKRDLDDLSPPHHKYHLEDDPNPLKRMRASPNRRSGLPVATPVNSSLDLMDNHHQSSSSLDHSSLEPISSHHQHHDELRDPYHHSTESNYQFPSNHSLSNLDHGMLPHNHLQQGGYGSSYGPNSLGGPVHHVQQEVGLSGIELIGGHH